jgi:plastocyanin
MKIRILIFTLFIIISQPLCHAVTINVKVGENGSLTFNPSNFNCNVGDTVLFIWSSGFHTATSTTVPAGAPAFDSPISANSQTFMYVVTVPGTYNFVCTPHAAVMSGSFTASTVSVKSKQSKDQALVLYPNPVKTKLHVVLNVHSASQMVIYDLLGNEVKKMNVVANKNDYMFNLENNKSGVYFLKVLDGNRTLAVKKFIIE